MKNILALLVLGSLNFVSASELQDSTLNLNKEKEKIQVTEENQQKKQGDNEGVKDRNRARGGDQLPEGKKRGKDVFIDKDGDGIADTRAGGMSLNKIRKRNRAGNSGSGGHGGGGGYRGGN